MSKSDHSRLGSARITLLMLLLLSFSLPFIQNAYASPSEPAAAVTTTSKVCYLYYFDSGIGLDYETILEPLGIELFFVEKSEMNYNHFNTFDLILIDGQFTIWTQHEMDLISNATTNVVALGTSAGMIMEEFGGPASPVDYTFNSGGSRDLIVEAPEHPIFNFPNQLPDEINVTTGYTNNYYLMNSYNRTDVEFFARDSVIDTDPDPQIPDRKYYGLYRWTAPSGQNYTVFHFNEDPDPDFTTQGSQLTKNIFVNSLPETTPCCPCPEAGNGDDSILDQILDTITDPDNLPGVGSAAGIALILGLLLGLCASKGKKKGGKKP